MMTQLADLIESVDPIRFNIEWWTGKVDYSDANVFPKYTGNHYADNNYINVHDCSTAGCVAGWALAMTSSYGSTCASSDFSKEAATVLGITTHEARDLFHVDGFWYRNRNLLRIPTIRESYEDDCNIYSGCGDSLHYCGDEVDPKFVTNDVVAKALRMIVNGYLELRTEEYPYE
jgi:hypothetical protein